MDFHELRTKTIAELREVAEGIEELTGYTQMRKPQLLELICRHLGLEMHEHHDVVGIDKPGIKQEIRALRRRRDEVLAGADKSELPQIRHRIKRLKGSLRRSTV